MLNNIDINQLLGMLSKINKNDLEKAVLQANKIMNSPKKDEIISELKKKMN